MTGPGVGPVTASGSWSALLSGSSLKVLVLCLLAVWVHSADALVVTTMLPAIVREIGGTAIMHLSVGLYETGSVVGAAVSAALHSRFRFWNAFSLTAALFGLGCLAAAFSPAFSVFAASRLLQGLGGGALVGLTFIALRRGFAESQQGRAMACVTSAWAISALLGPVLGALAIRFGQWQTPFYAFALQGMLLGLLPQILPIKAKLDYLQKTAVAVGSVVIAVLLLLTGVLALVFAGLPLIATAQKLPLAIAGFFLISLAVWKDRKSSENRLLPFAAPAGESRHILGLLTVMLLAAGTIAINIYMPFFLVRLQRLPELVAGYIFSLEAISWTIAAYLVSGRLPDHDMRAILTGAALIMASALALWVGITQGLLAVTVFGSGLQGAGFGFCWASLMRQIGSQAPEIEADRAAAAIPLLQRMGFVLGALFLGLVAHLARLNDTATIETLAAASRFIFAAPLLPLLLATALAIFWQRQ